MVYYFSKNCNYIQYPNTEVSIIIDIKKKQFAVLEWQNIVLLMKLDRLKIIYIILKDIL